MSRKILFISIFILTFTITSVFLVINININNEREKQNIYAEDEDSMAVEYLLPENNVKFTTEIVDLTNDEGQNYFVNYRIKREQMRQETKEMLQVLLGSDIEETRRQAQKRWLELIDKIAKEGEIENILKIQGFKDVVCDVNGKEVNVTVLSKSLDDEEINIIKKVALSVTGTYPEKVRIKSKF